MYSAAPNILVVHPSVPAKNVKEFVAYAKSAPGKMAYSSSGVGASPHLTMELFKATTGIDLVHVPYKDVGQGFTDLVGGRVQAAFGNLQAHLQNVKSGRVRALAVSSAKRVEQLPEVPTVIESGLPGFEVTVWQGIAVPAATPKPMIDRLHATMMKTLAAPDLRRRFAEQGVVATTSTPEEFAVLIKSETVRWTRVVRDTGATLD
jgi:tripartite-type tricarboxylate transporter receptor subunit TctC